MVLQINIPGIGAYENAFLPERMPLSEIIGSIPNLFGAFRADQGFSGSLWTPEYGPGAFIESTSAGRLPVAASRDGVPVVRMVDEYSAYMVARELMPEMTSISVAMRVYIRSVLAQGQNYLVYGTNTNNTTFGYTGANVWSMAPVAAMISAPVQAPVVGWHDIIMTSNADGTITFDDNGVLSTHSGGGPLAWTNLLLGATAASSRSAKADIAKMLIAYSDISAIRAGVKQWLNS